MKVKLTRKQTAPRNLAAQGATQPALCAEGDEGPEGYRRKGKYSPRVQLDDGEES